MAKTVNKTEIISLINLLDDPDELIYRSVEERIRKIGSKALPDLRSALSVSSDKLKVNRLLQLLDTVHLDEIRHDFTYWSNTGYFNISEFLYIIARYEIPRIKRPDIEKPLQQIVFNIKQKISVLTIPKIEIFSVNHVLYEINNFKINSTNLTDPKNYIAYHVLKSQTGSMEILALIYLYIAEQLDIPLKPISIPGNLLLAYMDFSEKEELSAPLFYVNPSDKGAVHTEKDLRRYLSNMQLSLSPKTVIPITKAKLMKIFLLNLAQCYKPKRNKEFYTHVTELVHILNKSEYFIG